MIKHCIKRFLNKPETISGKFQVTDHHIPMFTLKVDHTMKEMNIIC